MADERCTICDFPHIAKTVDSLIAVGESDTSIIATLKALEVGRIGRVMVKRHRDVCRSGSETEARFEAGKRTKTDFAAMVRDKAVELLEDGELAITTQHGLQAQQMLDARETKARDRELMVALARMLSGAEVPQELVVVTEVPYEEITAGGEYPDD